MEGDLNKQRITLFVVKYELALYFFYEISKKKIILSMSQYKNYFALDKIVTYI